MADCDDMTARVGETRNDSFGGKFELISAGSTLSDVMATITTPWGYEDSYVRIDKGETKEYIEDNILYSIRIKDILYQFNAYVCVYEVCVEELPAVCTQQFRLEDQNGNPLSGSITGEDIYPLISVPASGEVSTSLTEGKTYTVTAFVGTFSIESTFTACTGKLTFQFNIYEECTQRFRFEDQNGDWISGTLIIDGKTYTVTGNISIFLEKGKEYLARAEVGDESKQAAFAACTDPITFIFTISVEKPTLTTSIISSPPYIAGTNIDIKTVLKSPTGTPLAGEQVFFYSGTEYLGGNFTNANGEVPISFKTGTTPATYEIHATHLTDDNIFVESNHVTFTTEEPSTCTQQFRLEDQNGTPLSGTITIGDTDIPVPSTGEASITLLEGQNYIATAYVGAQTKQESFTACTGKITYQFTVEIFATTSLTISLNPTEIGPSQTTDITGRLIIQDEDQILPGIPLKLYCDKGTGYQVISSPWTPGSGTGIVSDQYTAQQEDAGKTLKFKYVYEGSESLKLKPSESGVVELTVVGEPVIIETITTLTVSPTEIKPGNILLQKSKITEKDTGNTLPVNTFVHFYIGDKDLGISGTIADGYAYSQFKIPIDYIGPYICKAKYDGIVNKYAPSESTFSINVNPACVEHETEPVCDAAECHWWSDETCRGYAEPPPESTGSIGFIIKPHSWYAGNTEQAVADLTAKTSDIVSAMTKYFTSFIDIEFVSIDIYEDKNIDRVILKIYYKETNIQVTGIQTMIAPAAMIPMAIGAIAAVFVVVAIVGWIESWFADDDSDNPTMVPEDELIDAGQGGIDDASDDAAGNVYNIDPEDATALNDCLDTAETEEDIAECYGIANIPEENNTDDNAETFGLSRWTAALAVLYTLCESLEDESYCDKADELDDTLNAALTDFRAGTITKERFILTVTQELNATDDFLEGKEEDAKEEREEYDTSKCFITNPGYPLTSDNPCIITNTQAAVGGAVIGLGIIGIYLISRRR